LVSVLIPTHQRRDSVQKALLSLTRQTGPGSYEVIVAVDGSADGTAEMLAALSVPYPLRWIELPHRGRAAACNAALERARGEVVIVLDDDMEVGPDFIARHRRHHRPGARVCVLGAVPVRVRPESPLAARFIAARFQAHMANLARPDHVFVARDFYSGNVSLATETLRELGGFDASFGIYGNEDVELGIRLRAAGVELRFDPDAVASQDYAKHLRELARDTAAKGITTVQLARCHPEAFAELRLAEPRDASRAWLAARTVLLALTRRWRRTGDLVFGLGAALERLGLWRAPLFYRALLDYAFWSGADAALGDGGGPARLSALTAELHRGPIDLLLHR
jgi:GT2 family glycosyltransferase